jgi:hypothetical protein
MVPATQLIRFIACAVTLTAQLAPIAPAFSLGEPSPHRTRAFWPRTNDAATVDRRVSRASEGTMTQQDFCHALQNNDRAALKKLLDPELAKLDAAGDRERNFQTFKQWLERLDCVASVEIGRGVLRSNPGIKEFHVTLRTEQETTAKRDIGIRLSPKRYELDVK